MCIRDRFSAADVTDLKAAKSELETHAGKVWTFIFSLRREAAESLGYSKAGCLLYTSQTEVYKVFS